MRISHTKNGGIIVYPPYTQEELLQAKYEHTILEYSKLEKENSIIKFENGKLKDRNFFLENLIESTRYYANRGNQFVLSELLACLKSGKITARYQHLDLLDLTEE